MAEQGMQGQKVQPQVATLRYSVYNQPGPYTGQTIDQVRNGIGQQWNIPADAQAYKGKQQLDGDYVIQAGDQIEFHRKMGEKGIA